MQRMILLLILLIVGIFLCGCVYESQSDAITTLSPTPTTNIKSDPIVGIWIEDFSVSDDSVTYIFKDDGTVTFELASSPAGPIDGQWIKIKENQYVVSYEFSDKIDTFVYNPATDTLNDPEYPTLLIYRAGHTPLTPSTTVKKTTDTQSNARYKPGDFIQKTEDDSTYDKDRAWVILKVDDDAGKYTVGQSYYDPDARQWYKLNDDLPEIRFFSAVERDYPILVKNIDWNSVPIRYLVKNCDGENILSYDPNPPECPGDTIKDGVLSGFGDDVITLDVQTSGLYIFTMAHTGRSNFIVWLKDSRGYNEDLLVNEIGSYNGRKSARLTSGTHYLDISADGSWTIQITA